MNIAPTLDAGIVEVIHVSLIADERTVAAALMRLTAAERDHAASISREDIRRRFVLSRARLRDLIDRYVSPNASVERTPRGKPFVPGSEIRFNVSHTGDDAVFAFVAQGEVGIDIECNREIEDFMAVARRFFAPRESVLLDGIPEADRRAAFFRTWTRKEAVLKLTGDGMANRMKSVAVSVAPGERPVILEAPADFPHASAITISDLDHLRPPFFGAVATDFLPRAIRVTHRPY